MTIEISVWYFIEVICGCILFGVLGYEFGKRSMVAKLEHEFEQNKRIARKNRELTKLVEDLTALQVHTK